MGSFGARLPPTPKNQVVQNAASVVKNLSSYESSVLSRVLIEQARQVQVDIADGLVGPEEDSETCPPAPPETTSGIYSTNLPQQTK